MIFSLAVSPATGPVTVYREENYLFAFFRETWRYREYVKQSVLRNLRIKYKRSSLGYLWTMLHPLGMMAVLAVVMSNLLQMSAKDYAAFLLCGLLPWGFFASTAMMSLNSIRANARLFGQVPIPKYLFILSIVFSNLVNWVLALIPLLFILLFVGKPIPWTALTLPIVMLPLFLITVGISLLLAVSNVFFEDTFHLADVALQAIYFLCPVLYARELLSPELAQYLALNPIFGQIEFLRDIFYAGTLPDPKLFALNLFVSFLIFFFCLALFKRTEDKFLYFV